MKPSLPARPRRVAVAVIIALAVISMIPALLLGRIPAQTDWVGIFGPWGRQPWSVETAPPFNPGGGDSFFMYMPDRRAALNEWRAGRLPLWNPLISGGVPLLGMQTATPLDPLILLELILPAGPGMGLAGVALFVLAGLGVILYLRDRGVTDVGALALGGVAFMFNPYLITWLQDRVFLGGLATLPLALWAMERLIHRRGRERTLAAAALSMGVGYATLAGTLQTLALLLLVLVVRLAWLWARSGGRSGDGRSGALLTGTAIAAGLALGALPLSAGIEALTQSTRLGSGGYYADSNFLPWRAVGLWFNPGLFNLPAQGEFAALGVFHRRFMSGSGFGFGGVIALGLALYALVRRAGPVDERRFWAGLAGATLAFLFLLATPLGGLLMAALPWLRDVDLLRGLIVVNLALAILAGFGAAELVRQGRESGARRAWSGFWGVFLAAGVAIVAVCRGGIPGGPSLAAALVPVLWPGGVALTVGLTPFGRVQRSAAAFTLTAALAAELLSLHFAINTFAPAETNFGPHPYVDTLRRLLNDGTHSRFLVEGGLRVFPPNTGAAYGLPDVRGYSNIPVSRYRLLLECAENRRDMRNWPTLVHLESPIYRLLGANYIFPARPPEGPAFERLRADLPWRRRAGLDRAFLIHELETVPDEGAMRARLADPEFDPGTRVYLEDWVAPRPPVAPARGPEAVRITMPRTTRTVVDATVTAPGVLVLADAYYPGWRATLNGRSTPIFPANWGLRGVALPEGQHTLVFEYRPGWMPAAVVMTLAGLLATFFMLARGWSARRDRSGSTPGITGPPPGISAQ